MATEKYGEWAFLAGVLLALVLGLLQGLGVVGDYALLSLLLVVLGLVVGMTTVTAKETDSFLIASVALLSVGAAGLSNLGNLGGAAVGAVIANALANLRAFVAPAALVVALKSVYKLASTR
jgi:hypothetical protein